MESKIVPVNTGTIRGELKGLWYYMVGEGSHVSTLGKWLLSPFIVLGLLIFGSFVILDNLFNKKEVKGKTHA